MGDKHSLSSQGNRVIMTDFDLGSSFIPALHKPSALLPIAKHRESLLYLVDTHPVTIVVGQTGSGKTTQIPQFLERAGWCEDGKVIAVTQVCVNQ
jgi:ATP-dependent RNA helicase DDX35